MNAAVRLFSSNTAQREISMIQYKQTVIWDVKAIDVGYLGSEQSVPSALRGLAVSGCYIVTGAPTATVGYWAPGATIQNLVDSTIYLNAGTTAAPVWTLLVTAAGGLTLPYAGTFSGTTTIGFQQTATSLTTGSMFKGIAGVALTTGGVYEASLGLAVTGFGFKATVTGVYTGLGLLQLTAASATTGTISSISAAGLTSGILYLATAAVATLTTGRYYSANDGATEVWGIGANGHIHSKVSASAPSCAITAAHGITAATITAGSTDTCGIITTTGTQDNTTDSTFTITFGKTYTTAPKSITLTGANAAGSIGSSLPYIVSISATAVVIGVTKSAAAGATPSWYYQIIA